MYHDIDITLSYQTQVYCIVLILLNDLKFNTTTTRTVETFHYWPYII